MERSKCVLNPHICDILMKTHISGFDDQAYKDDDVENVVSSYVGFLSAVAQHTSRLNAALLSASAVRVFKVPQKIAHDFGKSVSHAFGHCHHKGRNAVSGKKMNVDVQSVCLSFKEGMDHLHSQFNVAKTCDQKYEDAAIDNVSDTTVVGSAVEAPGTATSTLATSREEIYKLYGMPSPIYQPLSLPPVHQGRLLKEHHTINSEDDEARQLMLTLSMTMICL